MLPPEIWRHISEYLPLPHIREVSVEFGRLDTHHWQVARGAYPIAFNERLIFLTRIYGIEAAARMISLDTDIRKMIVRGDESSSVLRVYFLVHRDDIASRPSYHIEYLSAVGKYDQPRSPDTIYSCIIPIIFFIISFVSVIVVAAFLLSMSNNDVLINALVLTVTGCALSALNGMMLSFEILYLYMRSPAGIARDVDFIFAKKGKYMRGWC